MKVSSYITLTVLIFLFSACGGGGGSSSGSKKSVEPNLAPSITGFSDTIIRTDTATYTLNGTDPEGDDLTYVITTAPTYANIEINGDQLKYLPPTGFIGIDTFSIAASDGVNQSDPVDVTITVVHEPNADPYLVTGATVPSVTSSENFHAARYVSQSENGEFIAYAKRELTYVTGTYSSQIHYVRKNVITGEEIVINEDDLGDYFYIATASLVLSGDGRYAFYSSYSRRYRIDLETRTIDRFDVHTDSTPANSSDNSSSVYAVLASNNDGSRIVFLSSASNLINSDFNGNVVDAFMHDFNSRSTHKISDNHIGATSAVTMSADGNTFVYQVDVSGSEKLFKYVYDLDSHELISKNGSGVEANGDCEVPVLSGDASHLIFNSKATNLDPIDVSTNTDLYLKNLGTGNASVVNYDALDRRLGVRTPFDGSNINKSYDISFDGSKIALELSDNLDVLEGAANFPDVYVKSTDTGDYVNINRSSSGEFGTSMSSYIQFDASGSIAIFRTASPNLVTLDNNGDEDLFVHKLSTGETSLINEVSRSVGRHDDMNVGDIDGTGQYVVYATRSATLTENDSGPTIDIFIHDCFNGSTTPLYNLPRAFSAYRSSEPRIDDAAQYVCFISSIRDLVVDDTNSISDLMLWKRSDNSIVRINIHTDGTEADGEPESANISPDGTHVVFSSTATNIEDNDGDNVEDVCIRDIIGQTTTLISVHTDGTKGNDFSTNPVCSNNGLVVAYESQSTNLVDNDLNAEKDIFVRAAGTTTLISKHDDGTIGNDTSRFPDIDASGRYVVFQSDASNLVDDDTNSRSDVFLYDRNTDSIKLISRHTDGTIGNRGSYQPKINSDGTHVIFISSSNNLIDGDSGLSSYDIFVHDILFDTTELVNPAIHNELIYSTTYQVPMLGVSGNGSFISTEWDYNIWRLALVPTGSL